MLLQINNPILTEEEKLTFEQIENNVIFKREHYELASKLLGIPMQVFFEKEDETNKNEIYYRTGSQLNEENEINSIINVFRIFAEQKKLRGIV